VNAPKRHIKQEEIPGTESPERNPELHALALEIYHHQTARMDHQKHEIAKRAEAGVLLDKLGISEYDVDGVHLWREQKVAKIKMKMGDKKDEEE
jgi:hypothetical protein